MNNNTKNERSTQLGYRDSLKIEMLYKMKFGVKEIAVYVNKSERTIYRELKIGIVELRNSDWTTRKKYSAYAAQEIHEDRQRNEGSPIKLGKDHAYRKVYRKKDVSVCDIAANKESRLTIRDPNKRKDIIQLDRVGYILEHKQQGSAQLGI